MLLKDQSLELVSQVICLLDRVGRSLHIAAFNWLAANIIIAFVNTSRSAGQHECLRTRRRAIDAVTVIALVHNCVRIYIAGTRA
jgi:hypothetical protein